MEKYRLHFKAVNGFPSSCDLTILKTLQLVVASETGEGMSVTNAAELIATEVVKRYGFDPRRMLFIEHYPLSVRPLPFGESYNLVTFSWQNGQAENPQWQHMKVDEVTEILRVMAD